jgi:hypothetical protein
MRRASFAALAACLLVGSAAAQSTPQKNFMKTVSLLMYGEDRCKHLRVNLLMISNAATALGISPSDWGDGGRFQPFMVQAYKDTLNVFGPKSDGVLCPLLEDGFGPDGSMIPGAIKRR